MDSGPHRSFRGRRLDAPGHQLAFVRGHDRRRELVLSISKATVGRPDGIRLALAAQLCGERQDAHDGHDRRSRSADADGPERRVLPRAEDVEERDAAGADAGGISRLAAALASTGATALSDGVVRETHEERYGCGPIALSTQRINGRRIVLDPLRSKYY